LNPSHIVSWRVWKQGQWQVKSVRSKVHAHEATQWLARCGTYSQQLARSHHGDDRKGKQSESDFLDEYHVLFGTGVSNAFRFEKL
jgi:hypothetical protein